jgi:biopolymer transport protein TolQ
MESIFVSLLTVAPEGIEISIGSLLSKASPVVQGVLVVLVLMSLASWYIIAYKWLYLRRAQAESGAFLETFWQSKRLDEIYQTSEHLKYSPVSQVFRAGYVELTKLKTGSPGDTMHGQMGDLESIERALRRAQNTEQVHLESMVGFFGHHRQFGPLCGPFRHRVGHHGLVYQHRPSR